MSGEDRKKFDFYCNLIDTLFGQINELCKWDEPSLKNNLSKVARALDEIKKLVLFFNEYEDFTLYQDKARQVQDKVKSAIENLRPTEKLFETKMECESSSPMTPLGKEAKNVDKSAKKDDYYSKIPNSHYKRIIENRLNDLRKFYCF